MFERIGEGMGSYFTSLGADIWGQFTGEIFEICIIAAIVGVFLNMFGIKKWARKVTGLSLLVALLFVVLQAAGCNHGGWAR